MRTALILFLLLATASLSTVAQVSQAWLSVYDGPMQGEDVGNSIATDSAGNVYVAGYTRSGPFGTGDFLVIKYRPNGDSAWLRTFNGAGNGEDEAKAIAVDRSGNVYVTGFTTDSSTGSDFVTIKYNTNGVVQWTRTYDGPIRFDDAASALAIDASANVYVTGQSWGTTTVSDFLTIKYNTNGLEQWVRRDTCGWIGQDYAYAIALDVSGAHVYVTGTSIGSGISFDMYTSSYFTANGGVAWSQRYDGPASAGDEARSIAVDRLGNTCVTGFVNDGPSTTKDYATIRYGSSGIQEWARFYDGTSNADDIAEAAAVDSAGNVYVTGLSLGDTTNNDFATIKYSSQGVEQWVRRYNGEGNANDAAQVITVDRFSNVYISGTGGNLFIARITTVKYSTTGTLEWVVLSGIPGRGRSVKVDDAGSVYVAGNSGGLNPDCVSIRYTQTTDVALATRNTADAFVLCQNYPNPFNPTTTIAFTLPSHGTNIAEGREREGSHVTLKVHDVLGREVATLVDEHLQPGSYETTFDARGLASGVYLYRISVVPPARRDLVPTDSRDGQASEFVATKRLLLLK